MSRRSSLLINTLLYSDVFDYPLRKDEIWKHLISPKKISKNNFTEELLKTKSITLRNDFFCILKNEKNIKKRLIREKESLLKIDLAKKIAKKLSIVPWILLIGISGSLALKNAKKEDDIDFFVITSKNSLWKTRFFMILILKALGAHRGKNSKKITNKICLNLIISEDAISFPKERRDLYTAHEIVQIMPILNRDQTFEKFLKANDWVKKYMPNCLEDFKKNPRLNSNNKKSKKKQTFKFFDSFFKKIQMISIKRSLSTETITDNFLAFHPFDYRNKILAEYYKKIKDYEKI